MSTYTTVRLLVALLSAPFLASGQKVTPALTPKTIDLSNKTFLMELEPDTSTAGRDLHMLFLFYKDGSATFRVKRGDTILKDSPINWRFSGDSLCVQPGPISIESEGSTQTINRKPLMYFITKIPGGYLLKGEDDQMTLIEQK